MYISQKFLNAIIDNRNSESGDSNSQILIHGWPHKRHTRMYANKHAHSHSLTHSLAHSPATTEYLLENLCTEFLSLLQCRYEKTFRDAVSYVNMFVLVRSLTLSSSLSLCCHRRRRRRRRHRRFCCMDFRLHIFRLKRSKSSDGGMNASIFVISSSTIPLSQPEALSSSLGFIFHRHQNGRE